MKALLTVLSVSLIVPAAFALDKAQLTRDWCTYSIENNEAKVFYKIQLQKKDILKIVRDGRTVVTGTWKISGENELTFKYKNTTGALYPHGKLMAELTIDSEMTALSLMQDDNAVSLNACQPGE